jgi:hypothetical protein
MSAEVWSGANPRATVRAVWDGKNDDDEGALD